MGMFAEFWIQACSQRPHSNVLISDLILSNAGAFAFILYQQAT